jgi:hypothetical protein
VVIATLLFISPQSTWANAGAGIQQTQTIAGANRKHLTRICREWHPGNVMKGASRPLLSMPQGCHVHIR